MTEVTFRDRPDAIERRLQKLLDHVVSRAPIKQAVMAIENGDQSVRWAGASGSTPDGTALSAGTPFFIASIDKLLNATIVLKLSETGRLDLDATICSYLPRTLTQGLHRLDGLDSSERITVRHLLGHTSGLADWLEDRPKGGRPLVDRILSDGDLSLSIEDVAAIVRDQLTPHFVPQDLSAARPRARYSDTNYMLIAALIEAVTRQPLPQVHEELILRPLKLEQTFFAGRSQPAVPTLPPLRLRSEGRPIRLPRLLESVWGLYSTTADMLTFLRALVRGEVFRDPGTLASMQQQWNRFGFPLDRAALRAPGWPIEYGLGLMRFRLPRVLTPLRDTPAVLGHTGSTGCWLFHCPQENFFFAGSVDEVTAGALPFRLVPRVLHIVRRTEHFADPE